MDVVATVSQIVGLDVTNAELDAVRAHLGDIGRVESWLMARKLAAKRRLDDLSRSGVTVWPENDLSNHGNTSRRDAEQVTRRQQAADAVPQLADSLETGEVAPGHLDALHRGLA